MESSSANWSTDFNPESLRRSTLPGAITNLSTIFSSKVTFSISFPWCTFWKYFHKYYRFLKAAADYGVPVGDLFEAPDLYERKNIPVVTKAIFSLGRTVRIICNILQIWKLTSPLFLCLRLTNIPNGKGPGLGLNPQMRICATFQKMCSVLGNQSSDCKPVRTRELRKPDRILVHREESCWGSETLTLILLMKMFLLIILRNSLQIIYNCAKSVLYVSCYRN